MAKQILADSVSVCSLDENVNHFHNNNPESFPKCVIKSNISNTCPNGIPLSAKDIGLDLVSNVPEMHKMKVITKQTPFNCPFKESEKNMLHSTLSKPSEMFLQSPGIREDKSNSLDMEILSNVMHTSDDKELTHSDMLHCGIYMHTLSEDRKDSKEFEKQKLGNKEDLPYNIAEQNHSEAGPDIAHYIEEGFGILNSGQRSTCLKSICSSQKCEKLYKNHDSLFCSADFETSSKQNLRMASDVVKDVSANNVLINFSSSPKKLIENSLSGHMQQAFQSNLDNKAFSEEEFTEKMQELQFHEKILKKDKEYNEQLKTLEKENQFIKGQISVLQKSNHASIGTLKEVMKTVTMWMNVKERERIQMTSENQKLMNDRDQALEDLKCVENAFADLHRRYENCKSVLEGYKQNEDRLRQQTNDVQEKLKQQEQMYEMLRTRTQDTLDSANTEIENVKKSGDAELAVIRIQLKKAEMKISSLEKDIEQKNKEITELSSICDDLVAKVGKS